VSDDSDREDLEYAGDYNDSIARGGAEDGHIKMTLFYMCCKRDPASWDMSSKCGIYMPGKLWNRRGAEAVKTKAWYCGAEKSEWEKLVQKHLLKEAKGNRDKAYDYNLELAFNAANFGCGCRFHGFKESNEGGAMVLEVIDKSQPGTVTMYAIRAAIPPLPLSNEILKVQKGWVAAGNRANAKDLYNSIPVIYPKTT
jgi:hypothetical protein